MTETAVMRDSDFAEFVGRKTKSREIAAAAPVEALNVTLDRADIALQHGAEIPTGWHGLYFNRKPRPGELSGDGIAVSDEIYPPLPLPRRMYAGERMEFLQPLRIGEELRCESELAGIDVKQGSNGPMAFARVVSRIYGSNGLAVVDERRSVYLPEVNENAPRTESEAVPAPQTHDFSREVIPDPVLLFRYSALTFNSHRIHYDLAYVREVEGYPDLVVHGPLTSTFLINLAGDEAGGKSLISYEMRARSPLYADRPFLVAGRYMEDKNGLGAELWAISPDGNLAMTATARYA